MAYRIAGIDVHKRMLAVVVADVEGEGEYQFERRQFGTTPDHLRLLSEWFVEQEVEEVVMDFDLRKVLHIGVFARGSSALQPSTMPA